LPAISELRQGQVAR